MASPAIMTVMINEESFSKTGFAFRLYFAAKRLAAKPITMIMLHRKPTEAVPKKAFFFCLCSDQYFKKFSSSFVSIV